MNVHLQAKIGKPISTLINFSKIVRYNKLRTTSNSHTIEPTVS